MATLRYEQTGVNYDVLDAFKRACQREGASTIPTLSAHGVSEPAGIRGESAYLLEADDEYLALVEEGLGTKNLVADAMLERTGRSFYNPIGIDLVATIVNDMITVGALPLAVAMHAAVGDTRWFAHEERAADLAAGFAEGCRQAGAVWGGGETPALKGIVDPAAILLGGSAVGRIKPKQHRILENIQAGDAMIFLASSGVQTNGLTLCRAIAERLPQGYLTPIADGRAYGEALLDPSVIYVRFVQACQQADIPLHYAVHVTGHGWRKLMRAKAAFVYRIAKLRPPLPHRGTGEGWGEGRTTKDAQTPAVFATIQQAAGLSDYDAYATFNMGVGFAVYVSPADVERTLQAAQQTGYTAWQAGVVEQQGDRKAVVIEPLGITFDGDTLKVR